MDDQDVLQMINQLSDEERRLFESGADGGMSDEERERLHRIEVTLDQCWDLLRQRGAKRAAGRDPNEAKVRDEETVENYLN
jgi:hypothetical protein